MAVHVVLVAVTAAALILPSHAAPTASFVGCYLAGVDPSVITVSIDSSFASNVEVLCPHTCLIQGFAYAAISEGKLCFCSSDVSTLTTAGTCDIPCSDSSLQCGAVDNNVLAVWQSGGGSPNFTMSASNTATAVTVTMTAVAPGITYLIDLGVQAPASYANASVLTTDPYLVPGSYDVRVMSMIEGTWLNYYADFNLTQTAVPSVDEVGCPIVWNPNEVYYCNVSVTMANATYSYTATFSDSATTYPITAIGSTIYRKGTPAPRAITPMVALGDSATATINKLEPITKPSQLLAFDMYANTAGAFSISMQRPSCASGQYSVDVGGCMSAPPDDPLGTTHTCPASNVFWPQATTCSSSGGVALVQQAAATWAPVAGTEVSGSFTGEGFHREVMATPVDLLPGDIITITGPVGKSPQTSAGGDIVAGVPSTSHHYVAAIVKENMPVQLAHSCITVNVDVNLKVTDDNGVATPLTNITSCERNITDVQITIAQLLTETFNASLNLAPPYYIRSNINANFTAVFSVAGPISLTFSFEPSVGTNYTFNDTGDYPLGTVPHQLTYPLTLTEDTYIATVFAQNKHNIISGPISNSTLLYVQNEVTTTWEVNELNSAGFLIMPQLPGIKFTDTSGAPFPTNASVTINWDDGVIQTLPFVDPGTSQPLFNHTYAKGGYYNVTAYIFNIVSGFNVNCTMYIVEEILNFKITNNYLPTSGPTGGRPGFGKLKNQYPMDKNLSFIPFMTQGTVDYYIVINDTSGSEMFRFTVPNPFTPLAYPFQDYIGFETELNMTVIAVNAFQSVNVSLSLDIVGQIRVCQIDDFSIVTQKNEMKTFSITFESVGAGTCLIVDFGDTNLKEIHSYGENSTCQSAYSSAIYHPTPALDVAINITHNYTWDYVFNVTMYAFNPMSSCLQRIMTLVTNIHCRPPLMYIDQGSPNFEIPIQFYKSVDNTLNTIATINCELTSNTKKRWQLYLANSTTGELIEFIPTMYVFDSWNKPQLTIPARTFNYNLYVAWYTLTMWDPTVLDPSWPFQKRGMTYFEITKTPLVPVIMSNAVSKVTRGPPQEVAFQPGILSFDPDDPTDKNFTVAYSCRMLGETWPTPDTTPNPVWTKGTGGGCFGNGPGLLAFTDPELILLGSDFVSYGATYEMKATITKDTRTAFAVGQVAVVSYLPPVINVSCASVALCTPTENGVAINPSNRVGLVAACVQDCVDPVTYNWVVADGNDVPFPSNPLHFPLGFNNEEVSLSTQFFDDNPSLTIIHFSITATGSDGSVGNSVYFMKINQKPRNGSCNVTAPSTQLALIDHFMLTCNGWQDPDGTITDYVVSIIDADNVVTTILDMKQGGVPPQVGTLVLPPGVFNISVQVLDRAGAFTTVTATSGLQVYMPSQAALAAADITGVIAALRGSGDQQLLNMVLLAQQKVADNAPWLAVDANSVKNLTQDQINQRIAAKANMINDALTSIQQNSNLDSLTNINIVASMLASILVAASKDHVTIQTIDTQARDKILQISQNIGARILKMDIATPEDLVPAVTSIAAINSGMGLSQDKSGHRQNGQCVAPWSDVENAESLDYSVIVSDVNMVVEANPLDAVKCNVMDVTRERAQSIVPGSDKVLTDVQVKMMKAYVVGESNTMSTLNGVNIKMGMLKRQAVSSMTVGTSGAAVNLPENFCPSPNCTGSTPLGVVLQEWPAVSYSFPDSASKLSRGTKIVDFSLHSRSVEELSVKNLPPDQRIVVNIPITVGERGNTTLPAMQSVNAIQQSALKSIPVIYTTFNVSLPDSTINVEIAPDTINPRLFLFINQPRLPTFKSNMAFTLVRDLPLNNGTYEYLLLADSLAGIGRYFLGVGEFKSAFNMSLLNNSAQNNINMDVVQNISTNYRLRITVNGAAFLNKSSMNWETQGVVVKNVTKTMTVCETDHLTSFGAGMFVMPNTIDFNYVFAHMGFADNLTIYVTLIICFSLFALMMIWARINDRKDVQKVGASPMPDNKVEDKYLYEILVFTGNIAGAQTDSVVQFILSGDYDETDIRTLGDDQRKILRKADLDVFVMAVPRPLGPLQFMRIWHDNSGKGINASWYLSCIVVRDVQTDEKFEFLCEQWFAVESDDGQIERLLQVAGEEQRKEFMHLFKTTTSRNLTDEHLWFSVFLRPARSRFTRCQRVGACFSLLFLSMLGEAMWYEKEEEDPSNSGVQIGPFNMSSTRVFIAIMTNLLRLPASFVIVYIFRKSRPRKLRRSRVELALERARLANQTESDGNIKSDVTAIQPSEPPQRLPHIPSELPESQESHKKEKEKEKKKECMLPWWFNLVGWAFVAVCIGCSCFFLLMYGITFGNAKTSKWVSTLILAIFSDILIIDPVKIFFMALLLSAICKPDDVEEDDSEEDEEEMELQYDEAWLHRGGEPRKRKLMDNMVSEEALSKLRQARLKELEMWSMLKEVISYTFFLWIFLIITYSNRDRNEYLLHENLRKAFIHEGRDMDFTQVNTPDNLWNYLYNGVLGELRAGSYYNGKKPYGLRGYLNDQCNRIMGYAIIRQIRVKSYSCRIPYVMRLFEKECNSYNGILDEDSQDYCAGWIPTDSYNVNISQCSMPEFRYSTAAQLNSAPIWGQTNWYGGGGYVIHLKASTDDIIARFQELQSNHWIDEKTRAVLIEFSVYNSQVNLFGMCTIMAEFVAGGIIPSYRFDGIRLIEYYTNANLLIIICEGVFVLFILYFTLREIYLCCKQKSEYFNSYWYLAEISILAASYTAIIIYILRYFAVQAALDEFNRTFGNGYVRMQYAASLNEVYGYLVAFIVFVGTMKFIKVLRFHRTIGLLSSTLHQCWDDLSVFLIAFVLSFMAFTSMFYVLLNQRVSEFYSFFSTTETCFSMLLGKFDFNEMMTGSFVVPIMFFIFVMGISFVLLNLLLTIIILSFTQVKDDMLKQPQEDKMVEFVWHHFLRLLGQSGLRSSRPVLKPKVEVVNEEESENNVTVEEFPDKINRFLDYVNSAYFDGSLDVSSKEALKSSMYKSSTHRQNSGIPSERQK